MNPTCPILIKPQKASLSTTLVPASTAPPTLAQMRTLEAASAIGSILYKRVKSLPAPPTAWHLMQLAPSRYFFTLCSGWIVTDRVVFVADDSAEYAKCVESGLFEEHDCLTVGVPTLFIKNLKSYLKKFGIDRWKSSFPYSEFDKLWTAFPHPTGKLGKVKRRNNNVATPARAGRVQQTMDFETIMNFATDLNTVVQNDPAMLEYNGRLTYLNTDANWRIKTTTRNQTIHQMLFQVVNTTGTEGVKSMVVMDVATEHELFTKIWEMGSMASFSVDEYNLRFKISDLYALLNPLLRQNKIDRLLA